MLCVWDGGSGGLKGVVSHLLGSISKRVTTRARPPAAEDASVNNRIEVKTVFEHFKYFISAELFHFASVLSFSISPELAAHLAINETVF